MSDYLQRLLTFQSTERWNSEAGKMIAEFPGTLWLQDVLDFGCGPGGLTKLLKNEGANAHGVDVSVESIACAQRTYKSCHFEVYSGGALSRRYRAIFATHVLGHVDDLDYTMSVLASGLHPDGVLVVLNWNMWNSLYRSVSNWLRGYRSDPTTKRHFCLSELTVCASRHGLEMEKFYRTGEVWGRGPAWLTHSLFVAYFRKVK